MKSEIKGSVGAGGGKNTDTDVEIVQRMLNAVPMLIGPPSPLLKEDGDCGPMTIAAIKRFQKRAELAVQDGRIDPGKTTHQRLAFVTEHIKDPVDRLDLGMKMAPFAYALVQTCRNILGRMTKNFNDYKGRLPGEDADRARAALKTHFVLDESQNDGATVGRIFHRFNGIGVLIEGRDLLWRQATMKQAKIDTKKSLGDFVPSIYQSFDAGSKTAVFDPNYKQFDSRDGMGWGPQSLSYELIKGMACVELGVAGNADFDESDTPGYPGVDFNDATQNNPSSYASFAWEMRLRFAQPFGRKFRRR
jgi:hypothetical protein